MPILTLQRRMHEAGRIRLGQQVAMKNGKTRPAKLSTFRFTSGDKSKVEHLAHLYGGDVKAWQNGPLSQWEVVTKTDVLDVVVPPTDMAFSQFFEQWTGGGCVRRCDGQREWLSDQPCLCDPDPAERECKPTTRLSLMLAQVQGMGLWRVEVHGYYGAVELAGSVELIQAAAGRGHLLPATLRLDKRTVTRPGQPRRDFAVPVLDVKLPLAAIAHATAGALGTPVNGHVAPSELPGATITQLEAKTSDQPVPFTPVPESAPTWPKTTVAEQVQAQQQRADAGTKRTTRSAAPIPTTGIKPRTVTEARAQTRPATKPQRGQIHKACKAANLDDDGRHDLLFLVTNGRARSTQDGALLFDDVDQVLVACELLEAGHVKLGYTGEGDLRLLRSDESEVAFPVDAGKVRAWINTQKPKTEGRDVDGMDAN